MIPQIERVCHPQASALVISSHAGYCAVCYGETHSGEWTTFRTRQGGGGVTCPNCTPNLVACDDCGDELLEVESAVWRVAGQPQLLCPVCVAGRRHQLTEWMMQAPTNPIPGSESRPLVILVRRAA